MKLLWLDVETTGLDPDKDELLELAYAEATLDLPFDTVGPVFSAAFQVAPRTIETLSPYARDLHTKNGLLAECATSTTTVREIEDRLLAIVPEVADRDERTTLAGSSIHFDRSFLRVHMPRLYARLSYRLYDVSAVKLFCQSLGMPRPPKAEAHRATADVYESMAHAKVCVDWLEVANGKTWGRKGAR